MSSFKAIVLSQLTQLRQMIQCIVRVNGSLLFHLRIDTINSLFNLYVTCHNIEEFVFKGHLQHNILECEVVAADDRDRAKLPICNTTYADALGWWNLL